MVKLDKMKFRTT